MKSVQEDNLKEAAAEQFQTILHAEPYLKNFDVEVRITRKREAPAFPSKETMLVGWQAIGDFLGLHRWSAIRAFSKELRKAGVTFKKKVVTETGGGQPRQYTCTFPTLLLAWVVRRTLLRRERQRQKVLRMLGEELDCRGEIIPDYGGQESRVVNPDRDMRRMMG